MNTGFLLPNPCDSICNQFSQQVAVLKLSQEIEGRIPHVETGLGTLA